MRLDFTLRVYADLCEAIQAAGYETWTIDHYLEGSPPPQHLVLLRHDVDRRPAAAVRMARLENRCGLRATYYVRMVPGVFRPEFIEALVTLGHEVGYHYETLSKARGNPERAIQLFAAELAALRRLCVVRTISMHGRPLSRFDNRDLWRSYRWESYDLLGEAYLSIDYRQVAYLTDTGRSWHPGRFNLRDRVSQQPADAPDVSTTDELIAAVRRRAFSRACIQTHPERWAAGPGEWALSVVTDTMANQFKRLAAWMWS